MLIDNSMKHDIFSVIFDKVVWIGCKEFSLWFTDERDLLLNVRWCPPRGFVWRGYFVPEGWDERVSVNFLRVVMKLFRVVIRLFRFVAKSFQCVVNLSCFELFANSCQMVSIQWKIVFNGYELVSSRFEIVSSHCRA